MNAYFIWPRPYGQAKKLAVERIANDRPLSSFRCKVERAIKSNKASVRRSKSQERGQPKSKCALHQFQTLFMGNCFENRNVAGWLVLVDLLRRMLIDCALINSFGMKNRVWPLEN